MQTLSLKTAVDARPERVFDLARSVEVHTDSMAGTNETAVAGVTEGYLTLDDTVTWRARHFGVPFEMTVEITRFDRPRHFRDEQVSGPFARLRHDHYFDPRDADGETTLVRDEFAFASPAGPLGTVVDRVVLTRYLRRLLETRNRRLKRIAERPPD